MRQGRDRNKKECDRNHGRDLAGRLVWYYALLLATFTACKKEAPPYYFQPAITSPPTEAIFAVGEAIGISVETEAGVDYEVLEVYLDGALVSLKRQGKIDTLLSGLNLETGPHQIRAVCCDENHRCLDEVVSFRVVSVPGASRQEESFAEMPVSGWHFSNWEASASTGVDDGHSIRSTSNQSVAITKKHFDEPGNISFYVEGGAGSLEFMVDGKRKALWFGKEDWGEYAYSVSQGEHVFKWIANAEDTFLDKISFTEGVEKHTQGEYYGGGTVFWVDSTARHGLIAAREDGNYHGIYEIPWGCYGTAITSGNRAQSTDNGAANTLAIVNSCDMEQIAARYCHDFSVLEDGQNWEDWYLPAIDELLKLYKNRDKLEGLGGDYYWSSTSYSAQAASVISFEDGSHHGANRNIPNVTGPVAAGIRVRPIREF